MVLKGLYDELGVETDFERLIVNGMVYATLRRTEGSELTWGTEPDIVNKLCEGLVNRASFIDVRMFCDSQYEVADKIMGDHFGCGDVSHIIYKWISEHKILG